MSGLDLSDLKYSVVAPTLDTIGLGGPAAVNLLTGTALVESALTFLRQRGGGPALGLWQMEPATHDDCWRNYLAFRRKLAGTMRRLAGATAPQPTLMIARLDYACAMARIKYLRDPEPLPAAGDAAAMSALHKRVYNTPGGAADEEANVRLFAQAIAA